ncbi:MAG TPA: response regulator transcription factor [Verrucomicrobiae bacterium]|nr:response regulator transcription factor [Verrucomicrobiae bacterium]
MTKVAIVEDNRTTREGLETIVNLSSDFQCVCTCATAEEALQKLPREEPELVLMDIQLPNMSGVDCVERLKESMPGLKAIMVTVYEDPDRIFRALRAGASGYLLKRSAPEEVLNAMREVQQGGGAMSGEIARKVIGYFREQATTTAEVDQLTSREREVLDLVVHGLSNKEIAERLSVTVAAVRWHLKHIYHKLHVHSRTEAALKFRPAK